MKKTEYISLHRIFVSTVLFILCTCLFLTQRYPLWISIRTEPRFQSKDKKSPTSASHNASDKTTPQIRENSSARKLKKIYIGMKRFWKNPINFENCEVNTCEIIKDNTRTDECDAIILERHHLPARLPRRLPNQIWVFLTHEPYALSSGVYNDPKWRNAFNMTMSFRGDSEFYFPWGKIIPTVRDTSVDFDEIYSKKTKDIAWMVSNCHTPSKREVYVGTLKKIIPVDIYGGCGPLKCPREEKFGIKCRNEISQKYKFYLSFENALCSGYFTEKTFLLYDKRRHIIPVIRSAPGIKQLLPPNTCIDAADFPNAKKLGEYLKELSQDKERYIAMLRAKDAYKGLMQNYTSEQAICSLCAKLHEPQRTNTQIDLHEWGLKSGCKAPTDI